MGLLLLREFIQQDSLHFTPTHFFSTRLVALQPNSTGLNTIILTKTHSTPVQFDETRMIATRPTSLQVKPTGLSLMELNKTHSTANQLHENQFNISSLGLRSRPIGSILATVIELCWVDAPIKGSGCWSYQVRSVLLLRPTLATQTKFIFVKMSPP